MARIMVPKSRLHNNRPHIHGDIKDNDGIKTNLGAAALAKVF